MAPRRVSHSKQAHEAARKQPAAKPAAPMAALPRADPFALQRAVADPGAASPSDIPALQCSYGNRAVQRLIQTKLTVGPVGDRYQQEAEVSKTILLEDVRTASSA